MTLIIFQKKNNNIKISNYLNWIEQSYDLGMRSISINGYLEPLLSNDTFKIIEYANKKGINILLVTNGFFLTDSLIERLFELDVSLLCKLNVPFSKSNDTNYERFSIIQAHLFGFPNKLELYEKTMGIIYKLIDKGFTKQHIKTRLGIESVITSLNIKFLPQLIKQCRDFNIYSHVESPKKQGYGKEHDYLYCNGSEIKDLFEIVYKQDMASGYITKPIHPPIISGSCYQNLCRINISYNGDVFPCPSISLKLGNLMDNNLHEILDNKYLRLIRNLKENIKGKCGSCKLFKENICYAGCRGNAYQYFTNKGYSIEEALIASDPNCWRSSV